MTAEQKRLFDDNVGLAYWCAGRFGRTSMHWADRDDLNQVALMGLHKAACLYEDRGKRFASYARRVIMNDLIMFSTSHLYLVRQAKGDKQRNTQWRVAGGDARTDQERLMLGARCAVDLEEVPPVEVDLDELIDRRRLSARVRRSIDSMVLSERERDLIRLRLAADERATLAEIGILWGVSYERVRQIEGLLIARLKPVLSEYINE